MITKYFVSVQNDFNQEMTFEFKELHDALTLYYSVIHDDSITIVVVDCVACDENGYFLGSDNIRIYERDLNVRN